MKPTARQTQILSALCDLPTAPYQEQFVIAWLQAWAKSHKLRTSFDKAGNLYLHYKHPKAPRKPPLIIEAHMDHPGFVVTKQQRNGTLLAQFRGHVKPSLFQGARAQFFVPSPNTQYPIPNTQLPPSPSGQWLPFQFVSTKKLPDLDFHQVTLKPIKNQNSKIKIPSHCIGMWNLPDAAVSHTGLFSARVCDDIGGIAAIVCLFEELLAQKIPAHVIGLCSRAEEVGFAGVLAACHLRTIHKTSPVIGLETSKGSANAPQAAGPVIRVGDKTGLFSPGLTHFIAQAAGHIADLAPAKAPFLYQRKLMDGGTCNSTAFTAFGYDAAALCVPLGNYHNQHIKGDAGYGNAPKAGPGIASETINLSDFAGLVQILIETAKRIPTYKPGFGIIRERLINLHKKQTALLYRPLSKM